MNQKLREKSVDAHSLFLFLGNNQGATTRRSRRRSSREKWCVRGSQPRASERRARKESERLCSPFSLSTRWRVIEHSSRHFSLSFLFFFDSREVMRCSSSSALALVALAALALCASAKSAATSTTSAPFVNWISLREGAPRGEHVEALQLAKVKRMFFFCFLRWWFAPVASSLFFAPVRRLPPLVLRSSAPR